MRYGMLLLVAWLQLGWAQPLWADSVEVRVGGYSFPPFVDIASDGEPYGLTLDLLDALNRSQDRYQFRFVLTSPNRRFQDFAAGRFDVMLFEDIRWGWANQMMEATQPFLHDADLFVTRRSPERDQNYFGELQGKQIFAVRGYHYAFADFESDANVLSTRFRIELLDPKGTSLDRGLQQVASGQTELMIITQSYLQYYFVQRPAMREQLLQASKYDADYLHGALVRRQQPLTATEFDGLMVQLRENGRLQTLAEQYGVSALLVMNKAP